VRVSLVSGVHLPEHRQRVRLCGLNVCLPFLYEALDFAGSVVRWLGCQRTPREDPQPPSLADAATHPRELVVLDRECAGA